MLLLIRKDTEEDRVLKPSTRSGSFMQAAATCDPLTIMRSIREPSSEFFVSGKTPI